MKLTKIDCINAELKAEEAYPADPDWYSSPSAIVRRSLNVMSAFATDFGDINVRNELNDTISRMNYEQIGKFLKIMGVEVVKTAVDVLVELIKGVVSKEEE